MGGPGLPHALDLGGGATGHRALDKLTEQAGFTYMRPGQKVFNFATRGGWFHGGARLKQTLVWNGLSGTPPTPASSSRRNLRLLLGVPVMLLLVGGMLVASRRRAHRALA